MLPVKPSTEAIFKWIYTYIQEHGYSPALKDIAEGTGYNLIAVYHTVNRLVALGYITKKPNSPRAIALADVPAQYTSL